MRPFSRKAHAGPCGSRLRPSLDSSQLTPAERKAIDDFEKQIDVSNPDHILLFGADAQKKIADFSDTALEAVKTAGHRRGGRHAGESGRRN